MFTIKVDGNVVGTGSIENFTKKDVVKELYKAMPVITGKILEISVGDNKVEMPLEVFKFILKNYTLYYVTAYGYNIEDFHPYVKEAIQKSSPGWLLARLGLKPVELAEYSHENVDDLLVS